MKFVLVIFINRQYPSIFKFTFYDNHIVGIIVGFIKVFEAVSVEDNMDLILVQYIYTIYFA